MHKKRHNKLAVLSKSNHIGDIAELEFALEAKKRGLSVFVPIGHSHKADAVVWCPPDRPLTVQVKKGLISDSGKRWAIRAASIRAAKHPRPDGSRHKRYAEGDFDILCGFIQERNSFVFYRLPEIAGRLCLYWNPDSGQPVENNWELLLPGRKNVPPLELPMKNCVYKRKDGEETETAKRQRMLFGNSKQ